MESLLVKIFATALALSQVTTTPEAVSTRFDPVQDRQQVAQILHSGCAHMRKAFDVEDLNLDDLIATAMDDPEALTAEVKVLRGLNFGDLHKAYRQFCKNERVTGAAVDLGQVIEFYNKALADLPDHQGLKERRVPKASIVLDLKGNRFAEIFEPEHRRLWLPLAEVPEHVRNAFIAAEDKRFHQHKGVDERALIRAFIGNLVEPGRPQGGSTITQQVAKNLLVGAEVTYERKMREMVVVSRVEQTLSKAEILELYLNTIYLGRGAWGVEMAAQAYFGKPASELTLTEGALLAGLVKGPNYFNPDRYPERARERLTYVLNRMQENGAVDAQQMQETPNGNPQLVTYERPRATSGLYFVDQINREARMLSGIDSLTSSSYVVRSTVQPELQRATEKALQEGLARYEHNKRRADFLGPETNLAEAIRKIEAEQKPGTTAWRQALESVRLPLYDVHWLPAVVVEKSGGRPGGGSLRVGLADGRVMALSAGKAERRLELHDVVYVGLVEGKGKNSARAELRARPVVQGAALVLENGTGRILAMTGGFSYPLSQLNRATQAMRQPGSAIKPLPYLAALGKGLRPSSVVRDAPVTLPPVTRRGGEYWTPQNYGGGSWGSLTLQQALENSRNLPTVRLLDGGIEKNPAASLDRICALAVEAQIYRECDRFYPFVLGAQPVRPIDLAAFYATIANEGTRPSPHVIDAIELHGRTIYRHDPASSVKVASVDRASFAQLKTMLQGVLARGTARSIGHLAPYVGGKTGTTNEETDVWFVGFTNDVTVAVWIGYDNADGKRRTLGEGATGGSVAVPIFESVVQAVWANGTPKVALAPSAESKYQLASGEAKPKRKEAKRSRPASGKTYARRYRQDPAANHQTGYWTPAPWQWPAPQPQYFRSAPQSFTGARTTFDRWH